MKKIFKISVLLGALFIITATASFFFFLSKIPSEQDLEKSINEDQTPIARVRNSKTFSQFSNFKGVNNLTQEQRDAIKIPLENIEEVFKTLKELQDNHYRIDICNQLENKIQDYEVKTPGLSYFFRGSYDGSNSRQRHILGEIYSAPWYYVARYDAFQQLYKVISDAFRANIYDGTKLSITKSEILILGTKVTSQAALNHDEIVVAIDKSHHLLKMVKLIQYKKDNKYDSEIREYCDNVEESIIEENDFDYIAGYNNLLEMYGAKEEEFLTQEQRKGVDLGMTINFGWLRPKISDTFSSKKEKIIKTIESDINK
ncbi:hypothetical protein [Halobacteriovorax sp. HLS]|uniref:hypothetical protein n=1 Tax=Halobacteriovorax sp. HLS TaxID=2234000 RepID=UPI000FD8A032|nr:hypothetical protein [Halobacteriovorax sp. HLS]